MKKVIVGLALLTASLLMARDGGAAEQGFFISTAGARVDARIKASSCIAKELSLSTPLRPAGWDESVLDISIIVMSVGEENTVVSTSISIPTFPIYHELTRYENMGDAVLTAKLCMITLNQTRRVIGDFFRTRGKEAL